MQAAAPHLWAHHPHLNHQHAVSTRPPFCRLTCYPPFLCSFRTTAASSAPGAFPANPPAHPALPLALQTHAVRTIRHTPASPRHCPVTPAHTPHTTHHTCFLIQPHCAVLPRPAVFPSHDARMVLSSVADTMSQAVPAHVSGHHPGSRVPHQHTATHVASDHTENGTGKRHKPCNHAGPTSRPR